MLCKKLAFRAQVLTVFAVGSSKSLTTLADVANVTLVYLDAKTAVLARVRQTGWNGKIQVTSGAFIKKIFVSGRGDITPRTDIREWYCEYHYRKHPITIIKQCILLNRGIYAQRRIE